MSRSQYVLGTGARELDRLRFQQEVWGPVTAAFLDRLGVAPGWRCLDGGCGPGFVTVSLRERVGEGGSLIALDESPLWIDHVRATATERGWRNVRALQSRLEDAEIEPASLDLVFLRWVLSFPPDPAAVLRRLAAALRPGGLLAVQDYNHEGISVFPESEGFRAVVAATRRLYATRGGDPWVGARLPRLFREAGLSLESHEPTVLCGGPGSLAFRWADLFFVPHSDTMVDAGVLDPADRDRFLREWKERSADPDARFFSPIVVSAAARRSEAR